MANLGQRIKDRRIELGMTVRGFAREVEVQPAFITDIEAGRRRPSPETLERISKVLRLPLRELQALDPRVPPEVKEWMESEPRVSSLLRQVRSSPNRDAILRELEKVVRDEGDEDEGVKEK